jgi:hypothetical protein
VAESPRRREHAAAVSGIEERVGSDAWRAAVCELDLGLALDLAAVTAEFYAAGRSYVFFEFAHTDATEPGEPVPGGYVNEPPGDDDDSAMRDARL